MQRGGRGGSGIRTAAKIHKRISCRWEVNSAVDVSRSPDRPPRPPPARARHPPPPPNLNTWQDYIVAEISKPCCTWLFLPAHPHQE